MLAGLDVGGTHTDAVLLDERTGRCLMSVKVMTRPCDVLPGIIEALTTLFAKGRADPGQVRRLTVSTTLGLNALLTGTAQAVGMLVVPGPGIDIRQFWREDPLLRVLSGAQDHRGRVIEAPNPEDLERAFAAIIRQKARAIGIVCKFSPKNPELERSLAALARERLGADLPLVLGSHVSGSLNFPRRVHTVWCNAALTAVSREFRQSLAKAAAALGLHCPISVLKADAGSFSLQAAETDPASTMGSGPAASLLGVWALAGVQSRGGGAGESRNSAHAARSAPPSAGFARDADLLMIDMGGTSTDLALLAGGYPLIARQGLKVDGHPTLIRTLWTRSLALGGDSCLRFNDGTTLIGPDRSGPAFAQDQEAVPPFTRPPTLTDALNVLGLAAFGLVERSFAGLDCLAQSPDCPSELASDATLLARRFLDTLLAVLQREAALLLEEVNAQPVYTIRELLVEKPLHLTGVVCIGGPAKALAGELERVFQLPVYAPEQSAWANALGAALALPTKAAELYADTLIGHMNIPDFDLKKSISSAYTLTEAVRDMREAFALASEGDEAGGIFDNNVQIVSAESFAVLDDAGGRGRILRVRAQRGADLALDVNP